MAAKGDAEGVTEALASTKIIISDVIGAELIPLDKQKEAITGCINMPTTRLLQILVRTKVITNKVT